MMKRPELNQENHPVAVEKLRSIFSSNPKKRICVVGPSCVGKSTLFRHFPEAVDMDELLFGHKQKSIPPLLTQQEIDYVCGAWTPEVGQFMEKRARELIRVAAGHPVFGTIVFPCDLVVELTTSDKILRERIEARNASLQDVLQMKSQIEDQIRASGIEKVVIKNV